MVHGVFVIELFKNGADERAPIIVAIHGRGDRPENWIPSWDEFPAPARIVLPAGHDALGDGRSWFDFNEGMTDEQFGAAVEASEAKLWPAVRTLAGTRKVLVTGFSQGGILSYALASRHPDVVAKSFPVSGSCPGPLIPKSKAHAAPIVAFHGTEDDVVAIKWDRASVAAFVAEGNEATLREYPVGHAMSAQERIDLRDELMKALPLVS